MSIQVLLAHQPDAAEQQVLDALTPPGMRVATDGWEAADVLISKNLAVNEALLSRMPRLRLVLAYPGALAGIDQAALTARGIALSVLPVPALLAVAEHTILLMLALVKKLVVADLRTRRGERLAGLEPVLTTQTKYTFNWLGLEYGMLYGQTLGLIGLGAIGREVALRARAFQMEVLYYKRNRLDPAAERDLGVEYVPYPELLGRCDFVSLHHRVTPDQPPMGMADFRQMKRTAFLINTARGALLDEEALYKALTTGVIAGAGLDVFQYEPTQPDNPLLALDNVIATPHMAGIPNAVSRVTEYRAAFRQIRRHLGVS